MGEQDEYKYAGGPHRTHREPSVTDLGFASRCGFFLTSPATKLTAKTRRQREPFYSKKHKQPTTYSELFIPKSINNQQQHIRDGTLKRWTFDIDSATCSATFESHVDWVNDAVLAGDNTLVSCSSDTSLKMWNCLSDGACIRTLHQHSDYVTCLAAAEKKCNFYVKLFVDLMNCLYKRFLPCI
ncbi:hypothetical protein K2173_022761 [Erythroxylum novogranatense]|uniref:Uncharacterized protein n=1 Tax=Erythroxylum novogranatense TaxID=1862640 RepID=A0AAV8SMQ2_9ROSI|nr:hypothetical protein K2173_022761 [Erythroxylum novogranatense]